MVLGSAFFLSRSKTELKHAGPVGSLIVLPQKGLPRGLPELTLCWEAQLSRESSCGRQGTVLKQVDQLLEVMLEVWR